MVASLIAALALMGAEEPQVVATAPRGDAAQAAMTAPSTTPAVQTPSPQTPHGLSTDEQISHWLSARSPGRREADAPLWEEPEERRMHGEVSASIGTGGYRDVSAWASMPLGENGELTIAVSQSRNAPWGYYPHGAYDPHRPFGLYDPSRPYGWVLPGAPRGHGLVAESEYRTRVDRSSRDTRREGRPFAGSETSGRP